MSDRKKVVVSGIHYPLTMMKYFIRALERRDDVELLTIGPYTGDWIPWAGGMRMPIRHSQSPDIPLPQSYINRSGLPPTFLAAQMEWRADLWLQVDAGWWIQKPDAGVVAHVATDPHVLNYDQQRKECDFFFNMQREYMKNGDEFLPYAFDPILHKPLELKKEYDGCLMGLQYENRNKLVYALRQAGFSISYELGKVYEEFNEFYNKSKVALNWSSLLDLNARTFEAMGMQVPLLTNRIPALDEFFEEGEHYLGFSTVEEAVEQFKILIDEPDYADYLAINAYQKAVVNHTWDRRIQQIFDTASL